MHHPLKLLDWKFPICKPEEPVISPNYILYIGKLKCLFRHLQVKKQLGDLRNCHIFVYYTLQQFHLKSQHLLKNYLTKQKNNEGKPQICQELFLVFHKKWFCLKYHSHFCLKMENFEWIIWMKIVLFLWIQGLSLGRCLKALVEKRQIRKLWTFNRTLTFWSENLAITVQLHLLQQHTLACWSIKEYDQISYVVNA